MDADWRTSYPQRLAGLADAWRDPDAWQGMTRAGGIDLPGEVAGSVALAEVVIHGWDVAAATGQPYDCDPATAQACLTHLAQFDAAGTEGMFGPAVPVSDDARARPDRRAERPRSRLAGVSGTLESWIRSSLCVRLRTTRIGRARTLGG